VTSASAFRRHIFARSRELLRAVSFLHPDPVAYGGHADSEGGTMTPEEFTAKLEELRTIFADKLVELEENPKWASEDEREEMVKALDELGDQIEDLVDALQAEAPEDEGGDE
jgi:hypothetical protein